MDRQISETGWRGSREGWLDAGYRALIDGGVDAVKIQPLARGLKLSRTSFYWFFPDREALLSALIELWDRRTTRPLIAAAGQHAETLSEAMLNVLGCFLARGSFDSRLEYAVRSWALQDEDVAARVASADRDRLDALRRMMTDWGHDAAEADVRARTVYLVQIGYISMQTAEDFSTRLARTGVYVKVHSGAEPSPRELARFDAKIRGSFDQV